MREFPRILFTAVLVLFLAAGSAFAVPLGQNITIADRMGSGTGWYGAQEDNEVEPGNVQSQAWDLEGFYQNGYNVTMVGGYNFVTGQDGYQSGDLFIDVNGDARYGTDSTPRLDYSNGNVSVNDRFGYDYVLDLNFTNKTYDLYYLNNNDATLTVWYGVNDESNPWRYSSGGEKLNLTGPVSFNYTTNASLRFDNFASYGLQGATHYAATFDLSFLSVVLGPSDQFITHFTMGCGNDNLMGKGTSPTTPPVPEPATLILIGSGLLGLAGLRRKIG